MRGAWGKPYGTVARVNIGQIILSVRCKDANSAVVMEALRRARYKFPGRQKIIVSRKWGFTNVNRQDYLKLKEEKRVLQCVPPRRFDRRFVRLLRYVAHAISCRDGAYVQYIRPRGNLENNLRNQLRA
jgi:large subunit ribosomal protein L10e